VYVYMKRERLQRDRSLRPESHSTKFAAPFSWWDCRELEQRFCTLCSPPTRRIALPLTWEVMEPSPPTNAEKQRRIRRVSQNLACLEWMAPNFRQLHPVGAHLPQEMRQSDEPKFFERSIRHHVQCAGLSRMVFCSKILRPAYEFQPALSPTFAGARKWAPLDPKSAHPHVLRYRRCSRPIQTRFSCKRTALRSKPSLLFPV